jgi:beta-lactamase regulating signal transducer with metallopeptidase domain
MTAMPMLLTVFSASMHAALASAGAWPAAFAHAAAPVAVAALWQGAAIALVLGLCLKCAERIRIHIDAAERFAVWAAAFAAVAALQFLPNLLPLLVRGAASGSAAGVSGNSQIGAQMGTPAHAPWFQLPHFEIDEHWALAIAAVWLIASLVRAASLAAHSLRLRRLWLAAEPVEMDANLRALLAAASPARRSESRRAVTICTTRELDRPSVIGFFAPRILIPDWLFLKLTPGELEQVVLHEAEHLSRRDDWTNLLQKIALVLFPLNPALVWIEQRLCREREMACDEGVVRRTQAPRAYAACLASLAARRMEHRMERRVDFEIERRAHALSLGAFDRRPELVRRVSSLLARKPALSPVAARALVGVAACGLLAASVELARSPQMVEFVSAAPVTAPQNELAQVNLLAPQDGGDRVFAEPSVAPGDSGFRAVRTRAILPSKQSSVLPASSSQRAVATKANSVDGSGREVASVYASGARAVPLKTETPDADFSANQPGVVVFTAWEVVETSPRRAAPVADYDIGDSTGPQSAVSENDSQDHAANQAANQVSGHPSVQITVTRLIFFVAPQPSANTVNAPVPGSNTPRPTASDSRRPPAAAPESGWLFFEL